MSVHIFKYHLHKNKYIYSFSNGIAFFDFVFHKSKIHNACYAHASNRHSYGLRGKDDAPNIE